MKDYKEWFVNILKEKFKMEVKPERIGCETYYMASEEVDDHFFEGFTKADYPPIMLYHLFSCTIDESY